MDPYISCPIFESTNFIYRRTIMEDANDLLLCYSDPQAVKFFNADNCNTPDFYFADLATMTAYMRFWEEEYQNQAYVRFSIIEKQTGQAIGTIEFCPKRLASRWPIKTAIVRIDVRSTHEKEGNFREICRVVSREMREAFHIDQVFTKAVPQASERIQALLGEGYTELSPTQDFSFSDYFIK